VKAALMSEYGQPLELIERDTPELTRPDHVLVRVGGAGVCATDLHAIDGHMEPAGVSLPRVLGHENAGWVAAVGDFVQNLAVGDPVIVYPPYSCGLCVPCRRGTDMHCVNHDFTGLSVDGGFADYVLVTERSLIKLPEGVEPAEVAPHADAGITAMHAVKRIAHLTPPGSNVAVIGVGGVGHIAVQLLHELGNGRVLAIDTDERRRELARWVGADEVLEGGEGVAATVRDATDGHGADVVIDFVGTDETHAAAMEMLAKPGTYSVVGYGGTLHVPSLMMIAQEQSIVGNLVGSWTDLYELVQLHAAGRIKLRSETHPLQEVNDVLAKLRDGEITGRAVLVP
jgi:NAD+-dependent secondary alcohol dehydrogenase Adh1